MKFSKWILSAALILSAQIASVQGQNTCDPCDPCAVSNPCDICDIDFCDIEYDFYVDALYWEVCKSDHQIGSDDGKVKYLNPSYDWGYRLAGIARWKCWDLGLRYTSLCIEDSKKSHGGDDNDKEKFEFDYDVLDIELGYSCCLPCGPMTFRPFMGAKLAWIEDTFKSDYAREFDKAKIDFNGYGLYIGSSARWELCSYSACDRNIPIALIARASTGILRSTFEQDIDGEDDRCDQCIYVPFHDLYVGLDFTFCDMCGCGDASFQIGYEAQYWGWREYGENDDTAHIGLGGLVLRFGIGF